MVHWEQEHPGLSDLSAIITQPVPQRGGISLTGEIPFLHLFPLTS